MPGELDNWGKPFGTSGYWVKVDLTTEDFNPGRNFKLLVGTAGDLKVVGTMMLEVPVDQIPAIPVQEGYNPIDCVKIIKDDVLNTADNIYALF